MILHARVERIGDAEVHFKCYGLTRDSGVRVESDFSFRIKKSTIPWVARKRVAKGELVDMEWRGRSWRFRFPRKYTTSRWKWVERDRETVRRRAEALALKLKGVATS